MRLQAVFASGVAAASLVCASGCIGGDQVGFPEAAEAVDPTEVMEDVHDGSGGGTPVEEPPVEEPVAPAVVINEIMYDPAAVPDDSGEWLELYNAGDEPIDLMGWVLRDYGSNRHVIDESVLLEPGGFVVLGRSCDREANGGYQADYCYGDEFQLANDPGDGIELRDASGLYVDSVRYDTSEPWPRATPGVSIELTDLSVDNRSPEAWSLATTSFGDGDLGTPGEPNGR